MQVLFNPRYDSNAKIVARQCQNMHKALSEAVAAGKVDSKLNGSTKLTLKNGDVELILTLLARLEDVMSNAVNQEDVKIKAEPGTPIIMADGIPVAGTEDFLNWLADLLRVKALDDVPMPWCDYCQCYHAETARHIEKA